MGADKKCYKKGWDKINSDNFKRELNKDDNGFAILTGGKFIMIDFDLKHSPPQEIYDCLYNNCNAVEQTPGGFHFWFLNDDRTSHINSSTDSFWNSKKTPGLDIRNTNGIGYCNPTHYINNEGTCVVYKWIKGNISMCDYIPPVVLEHLEYKENNYLVPFNFSIEETPADDIKPVLNGLSPSRADSYSDWIIVGMALKNSGYTCEVWDEWSQISPKYRKSECFKKWKTFSEKDKTVTVATLYHWLKKDNYSLFIQLRTKNNQITDKILSGTNSGIAEAFYILNPDKYIVFESESYYLGDNNIWNKCKSLKMGDIPKIRMILQKDCLQILNEIQRSICQINPELGESVSQVSKLESSETYKHIQRIKNKLETTSFLNSSVELLRDYYFKEGKSNDVFNTNYNLFAFNNCVFDCKQLGFRSIEPTDYISVTTGYDYRDATDEEKQLVMNFLQTLWPIKDVAIYMLKALSTSFTGYNQDEFFHVLCGKGSNGKSSLMNLCTKVFGKYWVEIPYTYFTKKIEGVAPPLPGLVNAMYARFLTLSEPDSTDAFQTPTIKRYTGNDYFAGRTLYGEEVTFKPQWKIWVPTNDIPELSTYDQGIHRRMRIVPFTSRFCHNPRTTNEYPIDTKLIEEIKTNESWKFGLLALLLQAFHEMNGESLCMPREVDEMTEKYMMKNNPVGSWLKKYYDVTDDSKDRIPKCDLFNAFLEDTNIMMSNKKFSEFIEKNNINDSKIRGKHYYVCIKRKDIENNDSENIDDNYND
jgi:P4 family phage/plasmid primase-like protien